MPHTHRANKLHALALTALLLIGSTVVVGASTTQVLDLTRAEPPGHSLGVPGMSVGGAGGKGLSSTYSLPLGLRITTWGVESDAPGEAMVVHLAVTNLSAARFELPSCVDQGKAHALGMKRRRTFHFSFQFSSAGMKGTAEETTYASATFSSASAPECSLMVQPGDSVLVRVGVKVPPSLLEAKPGNLHIYLRAICWEYLLEDGRYYVESASGRVQSNVVEVHLQ